MKRILFVISSMAYSGAARQLLLLARGLTQGGRPVRVCVLGGNTPWCTELRAAGIEMQTLGRTRPFDIWPFFALRRVLRTSESDVIHVWGIPALRAVALLHGTRRLWASAALPPVGQPSRFDARILRRLPRIMAFGAAEAARYQSAGVADAAIAVVRPAVEVLARPEPAPAASPHRIVVLGPFASHKAVRDAVWVIDMLRQVYPNLEIALVGETPPAHVLLGLAHVAGVMFAGCRPDVRPYLEQAAQVWIPARAGGVNAALEALAAGKPVIAARTPELLEVIEDGVTGSVFMPGNTTDLARQVRLLIENPARGRDLARAGQRRAAGTFTLAQLVERYTHLLKE